jgi:hypothetical protein
MSTKIRIIILAIAFIVFSFAFQYITVGIDFTRQGDYPTERFNRSIETTYKIANWPSYLLRVYPPSTVVEGIEVHEWWAGGLFNPLVILVNVIGWGLLGALFGALPSLILKWRKK